jgi:hypothetical protein
MLFIPQEVSQYANLGALAIVAVFAVTKFFEYLGKKPAELPSIKPDSTNGGAAGLKTAEWWELTFARIVKQCLDDHENKVRRLITNEASEERQQMLESLKALERQISLAVAELSRQIRDK